MVCEKAGIVIMVELQSRMSSRVKINCPFGVCSQVMLPPTRWLAKLVQVKIKLINKVSASRIGSKC